MNVVEKFISDLKQKSKKCIILLSGFDILHLEEYAKLLAQNINFELIQFKYPEFDTLNDKINDSDSTGIIVYGLTFPTDKLKFKPFYHISVSANRSIVVDEEKYNIYQENVKNNIVNKFKNMKDILYHDETYTEIFNMIIDLIMKRVYGDRYEEAQKAYVKELSESSDSSESSDESKSKSKKTSESTEKSESESNSETETESNSELETEYDEYNVLKRNLVKEELDEIKKDEKSSSRITGIRTIQSRITNVGKKKKPYKVGGLFNSPKGNTADTKLIGTRSLTNILKF
jgi:hypothetical protein